MPTALTHHMSATSDMNVQHGPLDFEPHVGGFPVAVGPSPSTSGRIVPQGEGNKFVQKWQEILAAFQGSEQSTAGDVQPALSSKQESGSIQKGGPARMPQSTDVNALLSRFNADHIAARDPIGLNEHLATVNPGLNRVAYSNRLEDSNGEVKISAKYPHSQSIEGKSVKCARLQKAYDFNATVPAAVSESVVLSANLLTLESHRDQMPDGARQQEHTHPNASSSRSVLANDLSPVLVRNDNRQPHERTQVESGIPALAFKDPSLGSSSEELSERVPDGTSASATDRSSPVEKESPVQNYLGTQEVAMPHDSSMVKTSAGTFTDRSLPAHYNIENATREIVSPTPGLKTGVGMLAFISARETVSASRAAAGVPFRGAHTIDPVGTAPILFGPSEDDGTQFYAPGNLSQSDMRASSESIDGSNAVIETFTAIDGQAHGPASQWTLSGSHRAEAGFQDPSLGWISVRAQAGAGGIHAAVVPASDAAAQVLNTHLAGLNAHMTPNYEHLNPVTLASPGAGLIGRGAGEHSAQHEDRGSNQREAQQSQEHSQSPRTGALQSVSSPIVRLEMDSVEFSGITLGKNSGELHVSVIA